jgi:hypothetical protein
MHICNLDFRTVLKDRLRPSDQSYSIAREGPTIPVQLHGGLRSPNKTVTSAGTTNNPYGRGRRVHRQCPRHLIDGYIKDLPLPSQGKGLRGVCTVATLGPTA